MKARAQARELLAGTHKALRLGIGPIVLLCALGGAAASAQQTPQKPPAATPPATAPQAKPASPAPAAPAATPATSGATPPANSAAAPLSPAEANRKAWRTLNGGLADKNYDRRAQVIVALGSIGLRRDVVSLIEASLEDRDPAVRQAAVEVLGNLKSRSSIPKLQVVLDDKSAVVGFAAARALWAMGDKSGQDFFLEVVAGDRKVATTAIHEGLQQAHEALHDPKTLGELGVEQTAGAFFGPAGFGVKAAFDLSKDKAAPARATSAAELADDPGSDARDALRGALMDKSWVVRAAASEALGKNGSPADIAALAPLLDDPQKEVRYRAAAAIIRASSRRPV